MIGNYMELKKNYTWKDIITFYTPKKKNTNAIYNLIHTHTHTHTHIVTIDI